MGKKNRLSKEEIQIIKQFEENMQKGQVLFWDVSVFEIVINFYLEHGKFNKALKASKIGFEQHPYSSEMMILKASALLSKGYMERAEELIDKAELFNPNDIDVVLLRVQWLGLNDRFQEAFQYLEEKIVLSDEEDKADLLFAMGGILQDWGKFNDAISYYEQAILLDPFNEEAIFELTFCMEIAEQQEQGILFFKSIIDKDPYSFQAWYCLGILYGKTDDFKAAIDAYEFAIAINDDFAPAHFNMGEILIEEEQYEKALEHFHKVLKKESPYPDLYYSIAYCLERLGKYGQAIEYYRKVSKINTFYDEAYYGIGKCLEAQDKPFEALHFYSKALKLDQNNPAYWLAKADTEYRTGNITSCLEAYQEAALLEPNNPEIWLNWSFVLHEMGNHSDAVGLIASGIDEMPDNADLYYRAVVYLIHEGKYKEAFNYLEKALVLDFDKHVVLFEYFPRLETQKALYKIIDQYRK